MCSSASPSTFTDAALSPSPRRSLAAVLPEQFFGARAPVHPRSGAADLLRAVLEDALYCVRIPGLAQEAAAWFFSEDERWPFAFVNVCGALGLDPAAVRRTLPRTDRQSAEAKRRAKRGVAHRQ